MTVTKFDYSKRIRDLMKDRRDEEKILANKKKNTNNRDSKKDTLHKVEDHRTRLERLIPEFYVNQKTISDDSEEEEETNKSKHSDSSSDFSELDEKQKKELFDRLKTKNKFFKTNNLKANLNQTDVILPFLPTSRIKLGTGSNNDTINSPEKNYKNYNKKYEYENGNSAVYGINGMNYQREGLIDYDPRIINIKKIREKFNIIKNIGEKKEKIKGVDLFIYDKKKWQKKNLREDRRNDLMKKIFSTIDMPKTNKNKDHKENDDHGNIKEINNVDVKAKKSKKKISFKIDDKDI